MELTESPSTSTSLLHQVRNGERIAWFRLVRVYTPLIEAWCRQHGVRRGDTEDIVQNVFVAVSQHIQDYGLNRGENSFRAWLWTITRSKIIDHLRAAKKLPAALDGDRLCEIEAMDRLPGERDLSDSTNDLNTLVNSVLDMIRVDFSEQTWTAFWQTCGLGRPPSEVAKEMGMTPAAICMCRARVMRRIRETIEHP